MRLDSVAEHVRDLWDKTMNMRIRIFACAAILASVTAGCENAPVAPESLISEAQTSAASVQNSNASFKVVHEGFNHGIGLWSDGEIEGPAGWCGDIEQVDRRSGSVQPSAGRGYALVSYGDCNAFWTNMGFVESGPYGPNQGYSSHFPTSGYVHELDIYLDSAWEDLSFIYAASVRLLDGNGCFGGPFCYFAVEVGQTGDGLLVNGHEVTLAGWYTFRFRFSEEDGGLEVEFELRPHSGPTVYTEAITESSFEVRDLSTFDIFNVGSGYSWFAFITPGLELPIDEQRIRPGK